MKHAESALTNKAPTKAHPVTIDFSGHWVNELESYSLSPQYYFRQFIFGLIFPALMTFMLTRSAHPIPLVMVGLLAINTLLYPYSRFVYEGVVGFIMGQNVF